MRFLQLAVMSALFIGFCTSGSAGGTSSILWRHPSAEPKPSGSSAFAAGATTIYAMTREGIDALDIRTGAVRWHRGGVADPVLAGDNLYANGTDAHGDPVARRYVDATLYALNPQTGETRWQRAEGGGSIAADEHGVAVAGGQKVAFYTSDGKQRWVRRREGGYYRLILHGSHLVALAVRSGAIIHGELESWERATGRFIGSVPWAGKLLALNGSFASVQSDFEGEISMVCGYTDVQEVSLTSATERSGGIGTSPMRVLAERRFEYVLENIDPDICTGARSGHPEAIVDGERIILASGDRIGLFEHGIKSPINIVRGARFVGGPFLGHYFVATRRGLETLDWNGAKPIFKLLWPGAADALYGVAGIGDRLYATHGLLSVAIDLNSRKILATYPLGCSQLKAVAHNRKIDVLVCAGPASGGGAELFAVEAR